jgi:hypothetical protein
MESTQYSHLPESLRKPAKATPSAPIMPPLGRLYFVPDLAERYKVHERTIRRWLKDGLLPPPRVIGRRRLAWTDDDLIVFESRRRLS